MPTSGQSLDRERTPSHAAPSVPGEHNAQDQALRLSGLVLEKGTGQPLEGVQVTAFQADASIGSVETDDRGHFALELAPGFYRLRFVLPGFLPLEQRIDHRPETSRTPVFLEPREDRAAAMVVETRRPAREMNLETLTRGEIERTPGTFGDPIRALESLPNVARPRFLDGALVVRGAEPSNTVVLLDGHPVPFLFHFGMWKSVINPHFVEELRFYPGGMPSRYGNVVQAVVDIQSREVPPDRVHGVADVNLTDTSLTLTVPLRKGSIALGAAARFSYPSLLIVGASALANTEAYVFPRYSDYQVRLDATVAGGRLSTLVFGAGDAITLADGLVGEQDSATVARLEAYGVEPTVPYQTRFDHLHLNYRKAVNPDLELISSSLVGRDLQISMLPFNEDLLRLAALTRLERWVIGEWGEISWRLRPELRAVTGLELRYSRAALRDLSELWSAADVPVPEPEVLSSWISAVYARAEWGRAGGPVLIPEVRASLYGFRGRIEPALEPRITARYPLPRALTAKAMAGLFSQMPTEREYSRQGNPDLSLMRAVQAAVGLEAALPREIRLESTLFMSGMRDLILSRSDLVFQQTDTGLGFQSKQVYFATDGWGYGGELTLKRSLTAELSGSISYAYTRSIREYAEGYVPGDYDQPHTLTVLGAFRLKRRWIASMRFRLGSGQPYTPTYGAWSPVDGSWYPIDGALNSARHRLYHQLDLRLDRTLLRERWRLNIYLDLQNVYLARNPIVELPNWNYTGAGSRIWIPLVPTFGMKGEF